MSSPTAMDEMDIIRSELFRHAMKGEWQKVVEMYEKHPKAYHVKITKSGDTALHIAVSDGQEAIVEKLAELMGKYPQEAEKALLIANEKDKNTPLHLAASLGSVRMCHCIVKLSPWLVGARNGDNETPLFLAALHGRKQAFLCLYHSCLPDQRRQYYRGNEGNTILHVAIAGEYLDLAFQIIHLYGELVNSVNGRGLTPLHVLAGKPTSFRSGSHLKGYSRIIYDCTFVDELRVEEPSNPDLSCAEVTKETIESPYPKNYETCIYSFSLLRKATEVVTKRTECCRGDAEKAQGNKINKTRDDQLIPSSYNTCFDVLKFVSKAMLVILGLGSSNIKKIKEKKEKHVWSAQIMKELLKRTTLYEYEDSGRRPHGEMGDYYDATDDETNDESATDKNNRTAGMSDQKNGGNSGKPETHEMPGVESPMLTAAKNGITEMVEKILENFPVAIHDNNREKKNVVLLAVEHRQPHVYKLLLGEDKDKDSHTTVKDSVFRRVDNEGNSALHLAATLGDCDPWLIPGAALQMQWEMKWYEFVKNSMPRHFFVRRNRAGQTPKDVFTQSHKELAKNGAKWLTDTSQSCSVVAVLIATVAFATSVTFPGGVKQDFGTPILEHHPAFDVFAGSSLVALCYSLISLIMFLAILTSPYQERDFGRNLPRKLLLALSLLFVSIAAMLVSFCAGHFFLLQDKLRYAAFPVYTVTCLGVTLFAIAEFPLFFDLFSLTMGTVPHSSHLAVTPQRP